MRIVRPEESRLGGYLGALKRALVTDAKNDEDAHWLSSAIGAIEEDSTSFLAEQDDPKALGGDIKLPDGTYVPRIPGFTRWMWDGEACGSINFRWQPGTTNLPPTTFGHIGYRVFSWKQNMGYASEALKQVLPEAIKLNMPFVELTTAVDNHASQRVIIKNGGVLHDKFVFPESHGGANGIRFRIYL